MKLVAGQKVKLDFKGEWVVPEVRDLDGKTVTLDYPAGQSDRWYIEEHRPHWFPSHWFVEIEIEPACCKCDEPEFIERELLGCKVVFCNKCKNPPGENR